MRKKALFILVLLCLTSVLFPVLKPSLTTGVQAQSTVNTIQADNAATPREFSSLVYDSGKDELFAADQAANVSVISCSTNTVTATVTGLSAGVFGMAYDPGKSEIFATNYGDNMTSVISDETNAVVATIQVQGHPCGVAYDSGKCEVFVANSLSGTVSVISDSTNTVVATVNVGSVGGYLGGLAYDFSEGEVFVANYGSDTVSVISDGTNTVVATIPVAHEPYGLAFDSGRNEVFACASSDVSVISDASNTVVASVAGSATMSSGGVAYDSEKGEIYVTNNNYGTVSVIADENNTVVATVEVGDQPYAIVYDSSNGELFVGSYSAGTITVISDSGKASTLHYVGDVTINSDGTVSPTSAPIKQSGSTYTLTSDVDGSISMEKSDSVLDGFGFTVDGVIAVGNLEDSNTPPTASLSFASNITVENFTVTGDYDGIELNFVSNATVVNNTVTGTGNGILSLDEPSEGIDVVGGGSNTIIGNDITHNYCGLSFLETVDNKIIGNNITDNHNTVLGGGTGLYLWGASNNTIYHNNFIGNPQQAGEDSFNSASTGNVWDDGYPSGGNYWSDYNASEIGSTGIGSKPYVIDSKDKDRYPLVAPFGESYVQNYQQEIAPPQVSVISPLNQTYYTLNVPLAFSVNESVAWTSYSLDSGPNATIEGNCTLPNLSYGRHIVTLYANSTFGVECSSETVSFDIVKPLHAAVPVVLGAVVIAVTVAACLLAYLWRRKRFLE